MLNPKEKFILMLGVPYLSSRPPFIVINITIILLFIYLLKIHYKYNINIFDKYTFLMLIVYPILHLFYFLNFGSIDFLLSMRMFLLLIMAIWIIKLMNFDFLNIYEKFAYTLAIISLIFYPFQLLDYDATLNLITQISDLLPLNEKNEEMRSILIWSMDYDTGYRNTGFPWEPKAYANFLIIAIIIRLVQNGLVFKDKRVIVYSIALLTTISTTGYIILFAILPFFVLWNKSPEKFLKYFIPVIIILFYVMQLDFMWSKIKNEWEGRYEYESLLSDSRSFSKRSLGRTPSMMVDLIDFSKQPIIGYGLNREFRTQSRYTKLVRVNGLTDWIASFGIVGIMLFLWGHYNGFKKWLRHYNYKGELFLVFIIMIIYFATTVTSHLFWLCLKFLFTVPNRVHLINSKLNVGKIREL